MAWFTDEKLASLKITKNELSKSVVALFEKLDNVKDKDSMVEFATSIKNLKNLKPVDNLFIAAFDPRLTGNIEEYIEELKNFRFIPTTPRAALPSIYLNTYGENEIEGRTNDDGKIPMTSEDTAYFEEKEKTVSESYKVSSDSTKENESTEKSDDKSQNQNTDDSNTDSTAASA